MSVLVHICSARGHYIGQVRRYGYRRWETVTGKHATPEKAMAKAMLFMQPTHKRARVLFIDSSGWYGPSVAMEAVR